MNSICPRIGRQLFSVGDVNNFDFTESLNLIKELKDQTFWLFKVTTLTQVDLEEDCLESLKQTLFKRIPSSSSVSLTVLSNRDYIPDSLKVKISFKGSLSYECILASVACPENKRKHVDVLKLPLLCVLSGLSMAEIVHSALEATFGCIISPQSVQKDNARWLIAILINEHFRRNLVTDFSLVYKVEEDMKFSCNLPFGELHHFWTQCIQSNSNKLKLVEVEAFINTFTTFFELTYGSRVSWFEIVSAVLNETHVSFENKVEMQSNLAPLLYCILSYIESDLTH